MIVSRAYFQHYPPPLINHEYKEIRHERGPRQGNPLSPLLFVIAIDPLQRILELATEMAALTKLSGKNPHLRISMYADDTALFVAQFQEDVRTLASILSSFGEVTGLKNKFPKIDCHPHLMPRY